MRGASFTERGQRELKGHAATGDVGSPNLAAERLDDSARCGQTDPRTASPGGEGIEDAREVLLRNFCSGVRNGKPGLGPTDRPGLHHDPALAWRIARGG